MSHVRVTVASRTAAPLRRSLQAASARGAKVAAIVARYDLAAAACCGAVLALALIAGYFHRVGNFGVESDFYGTYAIQAKNLMAGRPYTFRHHPPGYPLLISAVSGATGDLFLAGKLLSAFSAALLGWVTYRLVKALFGVRVALVTALLTMVRLSPYAFLAATDVVGAAAMLLPVWVLLRRSRWTFSGCFLSGLLAGVAYLIRANGLFTIIGIGLCLLFVNLNRDPSTPPPAAGSLGMSPRSGKQHGPPRPRGVGLHALRKRLARAGLFACGVSIVVAPWLMVNWRVNGSPFASTTYLQIGAHFYGTINDALGTSLQEASSQFHSLREVVSRDPARMLRIYLKSVLYQYPMQLAAGLTVAASLFSGAGLLLLLTRLSKRRGILLAVYALGYLLLGLAGFQWRLYFFVFPVLFLGVAYLVCQRSLRRTIVALGPFRMTASWLIVAALTVDLGARAYREARRTIDSDPRYLVAIARFLRDRSSPQDLVISGKPHLAYLAGLERTFPMAETAEEFLAAAREAHARYVVYSDPEAARWPGLESLRDPAAVPEGLRLIYQHEAGHTLIYEVEAERGAS